MFDNILSNAAKYSAGDLTVTLTPDGAVTFANHAPNLSCVQANQLFDRFFTVETARGSTGRGSGGAALRPAGPWHPPRRGKRREPCAGRQFLTRKLRFAGQFCGKTRRRLTISTGFML